VKTNDVSQYFEITRHRISQCYEKLKPLGEGTRPVTVGLCPSNLPVGLHIFKVDNDPSKYSIMLFK